MAKGPSLEITQMLDDVKIALSHQLARTRQRAAMEELDEKSVRALSQCVDALQKVARIEQSGVLSMDLSGMTDEEIARLKEEAVNFMHSQK